MSVFLVLFVCLSSLNLHLTNADGTPVVLWHGMGDSCCNPLSMGNLEQLNYNKMSLLK